MSSTEKTVQSPADIQCKILSNSQKLSQSIEQPKMFETNKSQD